jgi:hypothetical protein
MRVLLLQQQPLVVLGALELHQREAALELSPEQPKIELTALDALLCGLLEVGDAPDVPGDHRTGAVVTLWDDVFEVDVLERVILGQHGEPTFGGVEARAARTGEAFQRVANLQPHVVVGPAGVMQVHHEAALQRGAVTALAFSPERLVGTERLALLAIELELVAIGGFARAVQVVCLHQGSGEHRFGAGAPKPEGEAPINYTLRDPRRGTLDWSGSGAPEER